MVILATKVYGGQHARARQSLEAILRDQLGELTIEYEVGIRRDGFPSVTLEGEDAIAAHNLLAAEWGELPGHLEDGETYRGILTDWSDEGFTVAVGEPVLIEADELDLGAGSPEQIATRFGLVRNLPVEIEYGETPTLSAAELDRLYGWQRGPGRVNANSITRGQLRATLNRAGHAEDVQTIERLGLLEQSVILEEGTDPPGIIANIGPYVPGELAAVIP